MSELPTDELLRRVGRAAREHWPEARVSELEPLHGGISSLTFSATLADGRDARRPVVIKVAPPGLEPVRNRDVLRQSRVMRALASSSGVRVPEVLLEDPGSPPECPPLFVMEFVVGESYEPRWDSSPSPPAPAVVVARALAAASMLARLHRPAPQRVGLAAEPALSLAQELERWARLFATAGHDLRGDEEELHRALEAGIPAAVEPRILHGDYRLGNMQFEGERLAAIIDWEIWSVGDPRTDLAWLLMFSDPALQRLQRRDGANQTAADAMPAHDRLLAEYASAGGIEAHDLAWFQAFVQYKLASTMSVLAKRNRRLADPDPGLELVAATLPRAIERGLELSAASSR
ncbi:MAG: phosphotransferase family protein [Solirubrobacteraceae bacterium]